MERLPPNRNHVLQNPPFLHQLLKAAESNDYSCLVRCNRGGVRCLSRCDTVDNAATLLVARRELDAVIEHGLFIDQPFIKRLRTIARAFCCQTHRIKELIQYFAYYWVAEELLLDDFWREGMGGRSALSIQPRHPPVTAHTARTRCKGSASWGYTLLDRQAKRICQSCRGV